MRSNTGNKCWHVLVTLLLSLYLSFVFVGKMLIEICYRKKAMMANAGMSYFFLIYILIFLACVAGCYILLNVLYRKGRALFRFRSHKGKMSFGLFMGVFLPVLLLYLIYFYMYYPCGISTDTVNQWEQAHSMQFNDHHPVFHTLLIRLVTRIVDSYPFVIVVQIVLLAVGIAYLAVTLRAWGLSLTVVWVVVFILGYGVHTRAILFYAWKDTAMSLLILFLLPQMIEVFLSRGEWLKKPLHWIGLGALLAAITLVRHNAVLFTFPLIVLLVLTYGGVRKSSILAGVLCLLLILGVKGPVYHLLDVKSNPDTYSETIGLPMTILSSAYSRAPERMSEEAYQFMSSLAPQEEFAKKYIFGNYNSVKWDYITQDMISKAAPSPMQVLSMTWDTIRTDTILAAMSVVELTDFVWEPLMDEVVYMGATQGEPMGNCRLTIIPELEMLCYELTDLLYNAFSGPIFTQISAQIGFLILVMLLAWYVSQKEHGLTGLWLLLPILCYNFGTMLLLCGEDGRFFHFNCFVAYPIAILLLSRNRAVVEETAVGDGNEY